MLLAQPALGATVGVFMDSSFHLDIRYEAADGELNLLSIVEERGGSHVITDLGAGITPLTPECVSLSPNSVRCQIDPFVEGNDDRSWFFLKDGADTVDVDTYGAFVDGGAGPDTLSGTHNYQTLIGGLGNDELIGGLGAQFLRGREGEDSLKGGPDEDTLEGGAGMDVIAGGPGEDFVTYGDHATAVRISLDGRANDGAAGEDDWVRADVESAYGSKGRTIFIGNALPNQFWGVGGEGNVARMGAGKDVIIAAPFSRDGRNVLSGGAGDDQIEAGSERDTLFGGAGNDLLYGYGRADVILGGPGNDVVWGMSGADHLSGGRGNDRLSAGPGYDVLRGGPGRDHLLGNLGADILYARDRNKDRVSGGPGPDRARVDSIDELFSIEALF